VEDLVAALPGLGFTRGDCLGLRLAVTEAVVNGLRHGNEGDPTKAVHVRSFVGPDAVLIEVEDEGPGFDPRRVPDPTLPENLERPSGRGLYLMRHYMNWVRYSRRGNRVTLCKHPSL
jgi:serine/threonine-protein kinase RsbW